MKKEPTREQKVAYLYKQLLDQLGLLRQDFNGTPERVARWWTSMIGPHDFPAIHITETDLNQMVVVKDHIAYGLCPHHLLPVRYNFRIGYIPNGKVIGLSKLPRIAEYHLQFLPLQEELTSRIVRDVHDLLSPLGVGCQIIGEHMCMIMRGVESHQGKFVTTQLQGAMLINPATNDEFLRP